MLSPVCCAASVHVDAEAYVAFTASDGEQLLKARQETPEVTTSLAFPFMSLVAALYSHVGARITHYISKAGASSPLSRNPPFV